MLKGNVMMAVSFKFLLVQTLLFTSLLAKTKPIKGKVISDSNIYLSNVKIESSPSSTNTTSNENGEFSFDMPIKDRELSFTLRGYHPLTLDVIPFQNDSEVTLIEVIEVDYLDSVDTSIRFVLSRQGENILAFDMEDMSNKGFNRMESIISWDKFILKGDGMDGEGTFMIDGTSNEELDVFYNNIKINNIDDPLLNLVPISNTGLSEIIITNGGYSKFSASSHSVNYIPTINYDNKLLLHGYQNSKNNAGYNGFGSLGIKHATINGGLSEQEYQSFYSDTVSSEVTIMTKNYFSNIGLTNRKNFEAIFMGFQNNKEHFNTKNNDTSMTVENNIMVKVDQWNPFTGRISIYGMHQDRTGINYNQFDSLDIKDQYQTLGFSVEKDLKNYLFTFSTSSSLNNAHWDLMDGDAMIERQNSIFTGSVELFLEQNKSDAYFKDLKMVFSKERTTDVMDMSSDIEILPNYWDDHSFQFSTTIVKQKDNKKNLLYLGFGEASNTPYLEDVIKASTYSSLLTNVQDVMSSENRSSFDLIFSQEDQFEKYEWSYMLKVNAFSHHYENKIKHVPLVGNPMTLPSIVESASKTGVGFHFELQPSTQHFQFSTTILGYGSSDYLKFQLLPNSVMKNQISINNRFFGMKIMAVTNGKSNLTFINEFNQLEDQELQRITDYGIQISKRLDYKRIRAIISFIGDHLTDEPMLFNDIIIHERKFSLEANISIQ